MKELTKREDQIMRIIWRLRKAVIRDVLAEFPEPKPHYNTVATLVKILEKKGVLKAERIGNTNQYSPTQNFEEYREENLGEIKENFLITSLKKKTCQKQKRKNSSELLSLRDSGNISCRQVKLLDQHL